MRKLILSFALYAMTFTSTYAVPNPVRNQLGESYIEQYRQIAIMESLRSGIPASIKLAQGLLESAYGRGGLALTSNNHFGIKWRSSADGDYVESYDDEKDKKGNPIVSRFVKFHSPEESYQQHSELLMTRPIYRVLFTYDRSDYRSWAYGLKKAGYATNPKYAESLIQIIQQYHLDRFDIPTQLDLNLSQPMSSDFPEASIRVQRIDPSQKPFPTRKIPKETAAPVKPQNIVKEEEEFILYEVTDVASKNPETVKNPIPRR